MNTGIKELSLKEIQTIALEALKHFDSFCQTHKLRYFLACGTLIGAIRNNGFIPWDDDSDIYMPRKDYMEFIELSERLSIFPYKIISPYNTRNCPYTYVKFYDSRTVLIDLPDTVRYKLGVYLDVYPVDGLPDLPAVSDKLYSDIRKLIRRHFLFNARYKIYIKNSDYCKKLVGYLIGFIGIFFIGNYYFKKLDKKARSMEFDKCNYVGRLVAGKGSRERILKDCFSAYVRVRFEDGIFNAPKCYHQYLFNLYGDYMELPPEQERVKRHHNYVYWKQ